MREDVSFESAGTRCAAWLYRPAQSGPTGCVVLAHGFGAVREAGLDAYARRFADAGLVALAFDYRHFGASAGHPRQLVDIGRQLADWTAAIEHARTLPGVDPARIALWGTSFSGGHVVTLAARDPRIAAVVSQVPYLGLVRKRSVPDRRTLRLACRALLDQLLGAFRAGPLDIPIVGEPGSAALLQAPGAAEQFRALLPEHTTWENRVAARIVLRLPGYRPGQLAAQVRCPVLYCAVEQDRITPSSLIEASAAASPQARLTTYPGEHFEIYQPPLREQVADEQARFLLHHLVPAATT